MSKPESVVMPGVATVNVRLDSVQAIIQSLVLMVRSEELSGLSPWIYETARALTAEQKITHKLVVIGFHYAVIPSRLWKDFPTYLAHLEKNDPLTMRDKVLDFYLNYEPCEKAGKQIEGTRESLMADDVRLHILKLIAEEGELRSKVIMERLELSQSAASRHLNQLSATGYLIERRCSGAKCYSLNGERVQDTLKAVSAFLLCD